MPKIDLIENNISLNESYSKADMNLVSSLDITGIKNTALKKGSEIAKLQIQYNCILKENSELREKQEDIYGDLCLAKSQLANEKKRGIDLRTEQTNFYVRRNQLEELFLSCVEETRKDIERRKAVTIARSNSFSSSLNKSAKKGGQDNIGLAVKNEQFTASDKRKVLELLLSNENVLLFLYEKLFPRAHSNKTTVQQQQSNILQAPTESQYENLYFRPKTASTYKAPNLHMTAKNQKHYQKQITGKPIKFRQMSSLGANEVPATEATRSQSNFGGPANKLSGSASILTVGYQGNNPAFMTGGFSASYGNHMSTAQPKSNNRSTADITHAQSPGMRLQPYGSGLLIHQTQSKPQKTSTVGGGPVKPYQRLVQKDASNNSGSIGNTHHYMAKGRDGSSASTID